MSILPRRTDNTPQPRPNRAPCTIWSTRRDMKGCYVRTLDGDRIEIVNPASGFLSVSRSEARLLARRLNECLDSTVIR